MEIYAGLYLYNRNCLDSMNDDSKNLEGCNPLDLAKKWNNAGVNWLHIVDINGYKEDSPLNFELMGNIISKINTPVQILSNVNNMREFEKYLSIGAKRVVIDNNRIENTDEIKEILGKYPEQAVLLINANAGQTAIQNNYQENIVELLKIFESQGLQRVIYRDVSSNYEFNYDDIQNIAQNTNLFIVADNKLDSLEAIKKLKEETKCKQGHLEGIILSKPLYDETLDIFEVIGLIEAYPYIGDFYSREDIC